VRAYLETFTAKTPLHPAHLQEAVLSYLTAGGKYLRPCLALWCCRALGGSDEQALPAALAVEVFHTWTLVHDDIIDRDKTRRGRPTVHEEFREKGETQLGLGEFAPHYGQSIALLAGDVLHGWAVCLLAEAAQAGKEGEHLALELIREMEGDVLPRLIGGEVLDIQLSQRPLAEVTEAEILQLISGKTAALFAFSARAGAMLARGRYCPEDVQISALGNFGYHLGVAFQLQDDLLGLIGNEAELGKPVGSDIREGKRTLPLLYAWEKANKQPRKRMAEILGHANTTEKEIAEARGIIEDLGGVEYGRSMAKLHLRQAQEGLETIEEGAPKQLLDSLAHMMVERTR
jgi:geranylgeranyl diphosphate synthase type I